MSRKAIEIMGGKENNEDGRRAEGATTASRAHYQWACLSPAGIQCGHDLQSMWQSDRMKAAPSLGTQLRNHQKRCSGHRLF